MGIKAVLDSIDDVPEALAESYVQKGDVFVLQIEDLETHPDVRGLSTANKENVRKRDAYKKDLEELKAKVAEIPEDFDPEEWLRLKAEGAGDPEGKGKQKIDEIRESTKKLYDERLANVTKSYEERLAAISREKEELDGYIDKTTREGVLKQALIDAGVDPRFLRGALALVAPQAKVVRDEDGTRKAIFETDMGEIDAAKWVETWTQGNEGKAYVAPAKGSDMPGNNSKTVRGKQMKRVEFDKLADLDKRSAIAEGVKIVD